METQRSSMPNRVDILPKVSLSGLVKPLVRYWYVAVLCFLAFVVLGVVYLLTTKKYYRADTVLLVQERERKVFDFEGLTNDFSSLEHLNTTEQGLTSHDLLLAVVDKVNLQDDRQFSSPVSDAKLIKLLSKKIGVSLRRGTRLIDVSVMHPNPERAQEISYALVSEYQRLQATGKRLEVDRAREYLKEQVIVAQTKLKDADRKLQAFKKENDLAYVNLTENFEDSEMVSARGQLLDARSTRVALQAAVEVIRQGKFAGAIDPEVAGVLHNVRDHEDIQDLRNLLAQKKSVFEAVKRRYGYKHPTYIRAQTEMDDFEVQVNARIAEAGASIVTAYESASKKEKLLGDALSEAEKKSIDSKRLGVPLKSLQLDVDTNFELTQSLLRRLKEVTVTGSLPSGRVQIKAEPLVDASNPATPVKPIVLGLTSFLGLGLGAVFAYLLNVIRPNMGDVQELRKALGKPGLAIIPRDARYGPGKKKRLEQLRINGLLDPFRRMGAGINLGQGIDSARSILITSAGAGQGKTTVALQYAITLAERGVRTLFVDASLENPSIHHFFPEPKPTARLNEYLNGEASPVQICVSTEVENLHVVWARGRIAGDASLQRKGGVEVLLRDAFRWFDAVVVDGPSLGTCGDAMMLARWVDMTCLVVDSRRSKRKDVLAASHLLEKGEADFQGFVINRGSRKESRGMDGFDFGTGLLKNPFPRADGRTGMGHQDKPFRPRSLESRADETPTSTF